MGDAVAGAAELEAAGLYDPAAPDAAEHLALLEYMLELGATIDELVEAGPVNFPLVASRIALYGAGPRITIDEAAAQLGIEPEVMSRVWRAAGFPDPEPGARVFTEPDLELFGLMQGGLELFGEEVIIQLLRVLGTAAARIADASISAFFVNVVPAAVERDPSGLALARANTDSIALLDGLTRGFDTLMRHHLELGFRPDTTVAKAGDVDLVRRSVGFADLVDSTAWTQQLDFITLSRALTEFEARASDVVVGRRGRVVKNIGDEVMFVADDAGTAADVALALFDEFAHDPVLPALRAGIATGEVVARDGDYSGNIVNLAARALSAASPSTLLVDRATRDALPPSFTTGDERAVVLKGFEAPVALYEVTRAG